MKYDELTLMQFADGELDEALTAEIESARKNDKELQAYLEVYETTRNALIESTKEEIIPSHINDLIDNFSPTKKQNWVTKIVKNNPFKTSIFSAILASLVTMYGTTISVLVGTGGAITATQLAAIPTRGIVEITPDIKNMIDNASSTSAVYKAASSVNMISKKLIEIKLNDALLKDPNVSKVTLKLGNTVETLNIIASFNDVDGNNCKVAQIDDQLLIVCLSEDSYWLIKSY